ncbi:uncharacterized protein LOC144145660 [Haemaphysalis longicornis]
MAVNNDITPTTAFPNGEARSTTSLPAAIAKTLPKPDRCWDKAALACAATILTAATHSNSGFFFVAFMRLFDANREAAAWPTSIFQAGDESCGFIGMGLQKWFALSTIALIGSVLFWAGILLSVFAPNLTWMTVTFGAMQGAGSGIVCYTNTLLLMMYFDRYRAIAIGIRYAGYSLSSLIFPPVLASLEDVFSFHQVLLLFAGVSLHLTPLVLALKEPPWLTESTATEKHAAGGPSTRGSNCFTAGQRHWTEKSFDNKSKALGRGMQDIDVHVHNNIEIKDDGNFYISTKEDGVKTGAASPETKKGETKIGLIITAPKESRIANLVPDSSLESRIEGKEPEKEHEMIVQRKNGSNVSVGGADDSKMQKWSLREMETPGGTLYRKPLREPAEIQCHRKERIASKSMVPEPNDHRQDVAIRCDGAANTVSNVQLDNTAQRYSWRSLLHSPVYWLFVLGGVLADYSDSAILSTLVDSALDRGATRLQADMAIACSAPSQLVGRTILPLIADLGFIDRTTMTCFSYFLFAASVAALSATRSFSTYVAAAAFVSMSTGSLMTMTHVVAADYFGVDAVPATWVACGFLITPLFFCSPSILGFFRDRLGCYDQFYYSLAIVHTLAGILFVFLVCHLKRGRKSWCVTQ